MLYKLHQLIADTSLRGAATACGVNRNSVRWWLSNGLPDNYGKYYARQLAKLYYPDDTSMRKVLFKALLSESAEFRHKPKKVKNAFYAPRPSEDAKV